jgi:cytoskeleton protein RodZ
MPYACASPCATYHQAGEGQEVQTVQDEDRSTTGGVDAADGTIGVRLRAAREAAGLTVEQVCGTTRIRPQVLRDLEHDQLGTPGTAVYTRGHIRAVARAVGADPQPLVQAFDRQVGASPPSLPVERLAPVPAPRQASPGLSVPVAAPPEHTQPRWVTAAVAVLAVLVALLVVGSMTGQEPDTASTEPAPTAEAPLPDPPTAAPTQPASAGAELVLAAQGTSWLSVRAGEATVFEGTVEQGWTQRFASPARLDVRIGNASAVSSTCGPDTVPAGAEGAVVELTCLPQGLARP